MTTNRDQLPTVSRHTLEMTLLEGPDPFNGHCTCDRWSYRTADWADLGMKWAWHYVAESDGPDGHPLVRSTVKAELQAHGEYGGDCAGCGYPVVTGRTYCRTCEQDGAAAGYDHGDNCERPCCWEDTVARRVARDAAHQRSGLPQLRQLPPLRRARLAGPRGLHLPCGAGAARGGGGMTAEHTDALLEALRTNLHVLGELAVRYEVETDPGRAADAPAMTSPEAVRRLLGPEMGTLAQEQVRVLLLDRRNRVVSQRVIYQGNCVLQRRQAGRGAAPGGGGGRPQHHRRPQPPER